MNKVLIHEITLCTLFKSVSGACVVNRHTNSDLTRKEKGNLMFIIVLMERVWLTGTSIEG